MNLDIIAGTRPNFIKIASLIYTLDKTKKDFPELQYRLIHTGQHYNLELSGNIFDELKIPKPHFNLNVGSGSHGEQTAKIMLGYESVLKTSKPNLCIVVGDVNSTMACAIVASKSGIPIAHVEAGLRSGDMGMPEEINRIITDSISTYFFTTTKQASKNLNKEGTPLNKIYFVGNTMIDTLYRFRKSFKKPKIWSELKLEEKKYLILTLHRPSNVDNDLKLETFLKDLSEVCRDYHIIFPVHPRTKNRFKISNITNSNLHFIDPLSYLEFNFLVKHSLCVVTDSGGISEETTVMRIPCLTLRENTERPETIDIGTNELIRTTKTDIENSLNKIINGEWKKGEIPELWDGKSADRIVKILIEISKNES